MEPTIIHQPGRFGRPFFRNATQRYHRGGWVDLSDPVAAEAELRAVKRKYPEVTHMDIVAHDRAIHALDTIALAPAAPIPLAGPTAEPAPAMSPTVYPDARPQPQPQYQPQYQQHGPPPGMDGMTQFLYMQQEERLRELRERLEDNKELLRIANDTNRGLQDEANKLKIDLQLRDRTHEQDLRDVRNELEAQAAPKGIAGALAGLPPEAVSPIMQGVMGLLGNFFGGGAAAATAQAALPAGLSPTMQNVVQAATQIFPDEQTAAHSMIALTKILPDGEKLTQFFHLAGMSPPQTAQPHNANL